jgi:hypothetical protein
MQRFKSMFRSKSHAVGDEKRPDDEHPRNALVPEIVEVRRLHTGCEWITVTVRGSGSSRFADPFGDGVKGALDFEIQYNVEPLGLQLGGVFGAFNPFSGLTCPALSTALQEDFHLQVTSDFAFRQVYRKVRESGVSGQAFHYRARQIQQVARR